eukprot:m.191511 g.191511  ORF g.191511 m.191511 type:complete len:64 (-) comp32434_c0_seq25:816-1007(-)
MKVLKNKKYPQKNIQWWWMFDFYTILHTHTRAHPYVHAQLCVFNITYFDMYSTRLFNITYLNM